MTDQATVFKGAQLIDGNGGNPIADGVVVVEGDRITAAGTASEVAVPAGAEIVDVSGKTVMPGLFDCHAHLAYTTIDPIKILFTHRTVAAFQTARTLRTMLDAGFTTVRDVGGLDVGFRQAVEMGLVEGPRLVVSGMVLQTAGHGDWYTPCGIELTFPGSPTQVDGVADVQKEARRRMREGYDFIKICTTGGVASPTDSPEDTEWTMAEIEAIVHEASAKGKAVAAHAEGTQGIKNAILGGVWSVEHGSKADDEAIEMMVERGTYLVPTLFVIRDALERGPEIGLLPIALEKLKIIQDIHFSSFAKAVEAGVKIGCGTDALGTGAHGRNAWELELMAEHGMTPMQAIVAATKTSAEVCRISDRVGTIEPGKLADLLVVDGDPLADLTVLQDHKKLLCVMKEGTRFVDRLEN